MMPNSNSCEVIRSPINFNIKISYNNHWWTDGSTLDSVPFSLFSKKLVRASFKKSMFLACSNIDLIWSCRWVFNYSILGPSSSSSSIRYMGFKSELLSKSFILSSTSQMLAKLVKTNRLIRFWMVDMFVERMPICSSSYSRTSAVRLPKSLDCTKASMIWLAWLRRWERLSWLMMIIIP